MKQSVQVIRFEEDEMCVISCVDISSRISAMNTLEFIRPFTSGDEELSAIVVSAIEKLKIITDAEFNGLDFEVYRMDDEEAERE